MVTISFITFWYAAWTWLIAENWDTLDVSKWNELVNKVENNSWRGWHKTDDEVYDSTLSTNRTDIDLSSVVGSKSVLVYLEVYSTPSTYFHGRPKGLLNEVSIQWSSSGYAVDGSSMLIIVWTDENGKIQLKTYWWTSNIRVKVLWYVD